MLQQPHIHKWLCDVYKNIFVPQPLIGMTLSGSGINLSEHNNIYYVPIGFLSFIKTALM